MKCLCLSLISLFPYVHVSQIYRCNVTVRTDKVDVISTPSIADWNLTTTTTTATTTTYTYSADSATDYGLSPLPFSFVIQEKAGATDAFQTNDLITMQCSYYSYEPMSYNDTLVANNTNVNDIMSLASNGSSNNLAEVDNCPTMSPTMIPTALPSRIPSAMPSLRPTTPTS